MYYRCTKIFDLCKLIFGVPIHLLPIEVGVFSARNDKAKDIYELIDIAVRDDLLGLRVVRTRIFANGFTYKRNAGSNTVENIPKGISVVEFAEFNQRPYLQQTGQWLMDHIKLLLLHVGI